MKTPYILLAALLLVACGPNETTAETAVALQTAVQIPTPSPKPAIVAETTPTTTPAETIVPPKEETYVERMDRLFADRGGRPWYYKDPLPSDLKAALADELRFLGADNPGYTMMGDAKICRVFTSVGLACDYNTRGSLATFLQVNGHDLFPPESGTNPYCTERDPEIDGPVHLCFIGRPVQNKMLREAVARNAKLFKNGNLLAEDVKKHWN